MAAFRGSQELEVDLSGTQEFLLEGGSRSRSAGSVVLLDCCLMQDLIDLAGPDSIP